MLLAHLGLVFLPAKQYQGFFATGCLDCPYLSVGSSFAFVFVGFFCPGILELVWRA